jgi:hypothetical protein
MWGLAGPNTIKAITLDVEPHDSYYQNSMMLSTLVQGTFLLLQEKNGARRTAPHLVV